VVPVSDGLCCQWHIDLQTAVFICAACVYLGVRTLVCKSGHLKLCLAVYENWWLCDFCTKVLLQLS